MNAEIRFSPTLHCVHYRNWITGRIRQTPTLDPSQIAFSMWKTQLNLTHKTILRLPGLFVITSNRIKKLTTHKCKKQNILNFEWNGLINIIIYFVCVFLLLLLLLPTTVKLLLVFYDCIFFHEYYESILFCDMHLKFQMARSTCYILKYYLKQNRREKKTPNFIWHDNMPIRVCISYTCTSAFIGTHVYAWIVFQNVINFIFVLFLKVIFIHSFIHLTYCYYYWYKYPGKNTMNTRKKN